MAVMNVNPTRMELTNLKRKLSTARRGHKLLKDKRDELMRRFLDLVKENKALRIRVEEGIKQANVNMEIARSAMNDKSLSVAMMLPTQEMSLESSEKNVMSVMIPRGVGALHDGVRNILTVNNKAESLTDIDVVEGSLLIVHAEIVGAEIGVDIEVAAVGCLLEARDFLGGNILYHESLAAGVSGIRSGRILEKEEGKLLGNDLAVIPAALIVGVLLAYDLLAGSPLGDHVGAVADIGLGLGCPFVAVLFNGSLLNGAHGAESNDLVEVRAGICKLDGESLAVLAGLNIELIAIGLCGRFAFLIGVTRSIQIAFDHADNSRAVGGADIGIGNSLHGVLEVLGVELGAVGPLQAVTHGEGPGETVGADSVGLSLSGYSGFCWCDCILVALQNQQCGSRKNSGGAFGKTGDGGK